MNETTRLAYPVREAAALLGIGVRTTWREIAAGRLKTIAIGGPKNTRIAAADLAEYVESHRREAGAA